MVGHVLQEQSLFRIAQLAVQEVLHDRIAITVHCGQDLVRTGMVNAGNAQIVPI